MVGDSRGKLLKIGAICAASMVLFLSYTGCIDDFPQEDIFFTYTLQIYPENETAQFEVLLPIPINETGQPNQDFIRDAVIVRGNLNMEINETHFGPALLVNGTGDSEITINTFIEGIGPEWALWNLSLQIELFEEQGLGRYRVHSDMDNISLHMTYDYQETTDDWLTLEYEMIAIIQSGWQDVLATINEW